MKTHTREAWERQGLDIEGLLKFPSYIAELSITAAIEVDHYKLGRDYGFDSAEELSGYLRDKQILFGDEGIDLGKRYGSIDNDFKEIRCALGLREEGRSEKKVRRNMDEVQLKLQLLRQDLRDIRDLDEYKLRDLGKVLVNLCEQFRLRAAREPMRRCLAA